MDREYRLSRIKENITRRNRREREIKAFGELNELINKEKKLARLSKSSEVESRDDLEEVQNSSITIEELSYHKFLLKCPCPAKHREHPLIIRGNYLNVKIPCMIGHMFREHTYIDLRAPVNVMSRLYYNWIMSDKLEPRQDPYNPKRLCNFVGRVRGIHVFVKNFTYRCDFMILEDVRGIIDQHLGEVVLGEPFVNTSKMIYDRDEGIVTFSEETECVKYKMPYKFEKFKGVEDLDVDNIPTFDVSENNHNVERIKYSGCMALGPEYIWDDNVIKNFKTAFRLRYGKT